MENIRGHHLCTALLSAKSIVIDLGACEGEFAQMASERWGARVFAIEANPMIFQETYSDERVSKHNVAISDRTGVAKLYLAKNPEGNSLDVRHRDVSADSCIEVPCATLLDFMAANGIQKVDVLKVDIEGAEVALFRSLSDDDLRRFTQISVEFHDFIDTLGIRREVATIKTRMKRLGFWCIVYRKPNIDVLFLNQRAPGIQGWRIRCHQIAVAFLLGWADAIGRLKMLVKRSLGRNR